MSDSSARDAAVARIQARRALAYQLLTMLGVCVVVTVIWLLTGRGYFWPGWVYLGVGFGMIGIIGRLITSRPVPESDVRREMDRGV